MTARDRIIIVVVLVAAALGAFWFVGLAPKRKESAALQSKIAVAQKQLADAQQSADVARQAQAGYNKDYATLAMLGKAVPKSDALASLLYQMQSASHGARIDFNSLKVTGGGQAPAATATPTTPATGSSPAPATQAAATTLPPGAAVGSAGFPTMPFSFAFNGTFFDMERFLKEVQRFVRVNGNQIDVRGRLLSIDGFGLSAGPGGFPKVKATISATAYLRAPADDAVPTDSTTSASGAATPAASTTAPTTPAGGSPQ